MTTLFFSQNRLKFFSLLLLLLLGYTSALGQVQVNGNIENSSINNQHPFLSADRFTDAFFGTNKGKAINFPSTDLSQWEFIIDPFIFNFTTYPNFYDGLIVYNVGTGTTTSTTSVGGVQVAVSPGFYYFKNPGITFSTPAADRIRNGRWVPLADGASVFPWEITGNSGTATTTFLGTTDTNPLRIRTNNVERLRITDNGNVGIGTTTPGQSLTVSGTAQITGALHDSSGDTGTNGQVLSTTATGTNWIDISGAGIVDADGDTQIQVEEGTDDDTIRFDTAGEERMLLSDSGLLTLNGRQPSAFGPAAEILGTGGFESFSAGNFTYHNSTVRSGGPSTLFNGTFETGGASFHADRATAGQDWGFGYRFAAAYEMTSIRIRSRGDCCGPRAGGGEFRLYLNGSFVASSTIITGVTHGVWTTAYTPNVIADEVRYIYPNGADTENGDGISNLVELELIGREVISNNQTIDITGGVIINNGDLGVGTSSPTQRLDVDGGARFRGAIYDSNNQAGTIGQVLSTTATGTNWIDFSNSSSVNRSSLLHGTQTGNTLYWDGIDWVETDFLFHDTVFRQGAGTTIEAVNHSHFRALNTTINDAGNTIVLSENNNYIYVSGRNNINPTIATEFFISVVPLSNTAAPGAATSRIVYSTSEDISSMIVHEDVLYTSTNQAIRAYDISNPASPALLGTLNFSSTTHGAGLEMAIRGNHLYRSSNTSNILIVDISNPASMSNAGTLTGSNANFINNVGENLVIANNSQIRFYDLSNPTSPTLVSTFTDPAISNIRSVVNLGRTVYVTAFNGLTIVDFSNPSNPSKVSTVSGGQNGFPASFSSIGGTGNSSILNRNNYFISDANNDVVHIVNVEDPLNPKYVTGFTNSNLNNPSDIISIYGGRYVYVLNGFATLGIETIELDYNAAYVPDKVGIGTTQPDQTLSVNGNASKIGGGSWVSFSDKRVKDNIVDYNKGLPEIMQLRPVSFNYNNLSGFDDLTTTFVGLIAQEVEQVLPSTVSEYNDSAKSGIQDKKVFDSSEILWVLVNAVQELKEENEALKARIESLEQK